MQASVCHNEELKEGTDMRHAMKDYDCRQFDTAFEEHRMVAADCGSQGVNGIYNSPNIRKLSGYEATHTDESR